jgi:DNA polymerase-1
MNNILIIDGYNMMHRCRFSWGGGLADGDYQIVYNFFKILKPLVEEFSPDKVYFVLDGRPTKRLDSFSEYKANRVVETDDPEVIEYWNSFHRQKRIIINMVSESFPITSAYHPDYEADDLIYHLIKTYHHDDNVVISSSDTDFIQILNEFPESVKLWNPIAKAYRSNTEYDYVAWKAMVGDRSDNIPGVRGIGKKTATKILSADNGLEDRLSNPSFKVAFDKSYELIKLSDMADEIDTIKYSGGSYNKENIVSSFNDMGFKSMLDEPYRQRFLDTFVSLEY